MLAWTYQLQILRSLYTQRLIFQHCKGYWWCKIHHIITLTSKMSQPSVRCFDYLTANYPVNRLSTALNNIMVTVVIDYSVLCILTLVHNYNTNFTNVEI